MADASEQVWTYSRKQVNNAGDRMRKAANSGLSLAVDDMILLDAFRASHYPGSREVQERLIRCFAKRRHELPDITITARPLKTIPAIVAKLVREKSRLSTIQDIGGARIVVESLVSQAATHDVIFETFLGWKPGSRRTVAWTATALAIERYTSS